MRADELVSALAASQRVQLAKTLKIESSEVSAIVRAMRAENVAEVIKPALRLRSMREDIAALCANPFDPVYGEDVQNLDALCAIGMLGLAEHGGWEVNLDMALALVPSTSLEFGFAVTLLARLSASDFQSTARALGVSPQMNRTEYLLTVAEAMTSQATVDRVMMQLKEEERAVFVSAIELGELPDDISLWSLDIAPPRVKLDFSEAGRRGLLLQIEQPDFGVERRVILPLESADRVEAALESIPAPPPVQTKAVRRRTTTPATKADRVQPPRERLLDFSTPVAPVDPAQRRVQVTDASAVVDLRDDRLVRRLRGTPQLLADVAQIVERTRVVLRPGVDAQRWSARAALLLSEDSRTQ